MKVLVTGGAGYIGSHTVRVLKEYGHEVAVLDNLSKGHKESLPFGVSLIEGDLGDKSFLNYVFLENKFDAVVHFAGLIEVGESMKNPDIFYQSNVVNSLNLFDAMVRHDVKKIVFSSSAAVFGEPEKMPIVEEDKKKPTSVYGRNKLFVEEILKDYDRAYGMKSICLRYFNAAGAGYNIGEDHDPETHLIPLIIFAALGKRENVKIFGKDYPTEDGTCVRDYIHVLDLANAHVLALEKLLKGGDSDCFNLGSGKGYSVKEVIHLVKKISGKDFTVVESERREGDPECLVAGAYKIKNDLGWETKYGMDEIVSSAWEWHRNNPDGFSRNKESCGS
jgi:UDP-glucose 4-epimerase